MSLNSCFSQMDSLSLSPTSHNRASSQFSMPCYVPETRSRRIRNLSSFPRKPSKFLLFASKDDQMELKPPLAKPVERSDVGPAEERSAADAPMETKLVNSDIKFSVKAVLQWKTKSAVELENFIATPPIKEHEDNDWRRIHDLFETGDRVEVKLIRSSTKGFVVSFGSLTGFLPYRDLAARWKFLDFESWLRRKGYDPSTYKQNLGITGNCGVANETSLDLILGAEIDQRVGTDVTPNMKLEDLLADYEQGRLKFLSSFVGQVLMTSIFLRILSFYSHYMIALRLQKIKVNVLLVARESRRLIFSVMPKEKEEMIEKKRSLMAKLSTGDVLKCCIRKINYFGIFVEVGGVPALIPLIEISWDATLDPASYFQVGQIVEAKVLELDFSLERIFLSLKQNKARSIN